MRCALVDPKDNLVVNVIVADPAVDPAPDGYLMIGDIPDFVSIGTVWDGTSFVKPVDPSRSKPPTLIDGMDML